MRPQISITPAKNILELYRNLQALNGLSEENMPFHIDMYQDNIDNLYSKILDSFDNQDTFFIAGQTGSGKTTAVDYLFSHYDELKERYITISLDFQELTNIEDGEFHIVEVFIILMNQIISISSDKTKKKYTKKIKELAERQDITQIEKAQNQWSFPDAILQGLVGGILRINIDASQREIIRSRFKNKLNDVKDLLNEIITDFHLDEQADDKELLIFIDGLEKMRNRVAIQNIFNVSSIFLLKSINIRKIIAMPVHLPHLDDVFKGNQNDMVFMEWRIEPNAFTISQNSTQQLNEIDNHKLKLKQVVQKRIEPNCQHILEEKTLDKAIEKSGGLVVQLLMILKESYIFARTANSDIIRVEHLDKAIIKLSNNMARAFTLDTIGTKILYHVLHHNQCPDVSDEKYRQKVIELLLNTLIVSNENHTPCYFVNPLIREAVESYGKALQST